MIFFAFYGTYAEGMKMDQNYNAYSWDAWRFWMQIKLNLDVRGGQNSEKSQNSKKKIA